MCHNNSSVLTKMNTPQIVEDREYIYILLLRYPDTFSKIFRGLTRCHYNHASVGLSNTGGVFYSYVTKGFRKELPKNHPTFKQQEVPCKLYRIELSKNIHGVTQSVLEDHVQRSSQFKYNFFGVVLCLLHIVCTNKKRYFCSQFVAEILKQNTIVPLAKHSALYLPDDFIKMQGLEHCFTGFLSQLVNATESRMD